MENNVIMQLINDPEIKKTLCGMVTIATTILGIRELMKASEKYNRGLKMAIKDGLTVEITQSVPTTQVAPA